MDIVQKFFYVGGSLAIFDYLFGIKITPDTVKVIVPAWVIGSIILGYVDYKVGFAKVQNSIQNSEYTPFFDDLDKKIDELTKVVNELNNKNK